MKRRDFMHVVAPVIGLFGIGGPLLTVRPLFASTTSFPRPGKKDRCPVCGMFVHKYPKWAAGFVFQSGATYFHCCPKCMLHNLNNIPKYQPGENRDKLKIIWVTDYYTTTRMDARNALFVVGTTLVGPMGLDLIPVKGRNAAENLMKDYHGERILTLEQITPEVIQQARKGRFK